jgi:ParB/RepB/Spo0J family partition protein
MTETTVATGYQVLPLEVLHESPLNPRKHFDPTALADLAASIAAKGVLTPLLVRVNSAGYEIGAGHRRFRAAKMAGLTEVPAIVRVMDDDAFLELLTVENLQREDLHPLEEAQGYHQLIATKRYDAARVAEKVARSEKYVYDRLKLLSLIKPAQQLFLDGKFAAGHAILLARLRPDDQRRAIGLDEKGKLVAVEGYPGGFDGGLFEDEHTLWDERTDEDGKNPAFKARSVKELDAWIAEHVKFHVDQVDPVLFPETVGAVTQAREVKEKVVSITYDYVVPSDARDGQKVLGPRSWKPATGQGKDKACEHAITGVIVIGAGRGEALKVCIAKEKCTVHWSAWQKERAERAKGASTGTKKTAEDRYAAEQRKYEEERKRAAAERERWKKAEPAVLKALATAIEKLPATADGVLGEFLVQQSDPAPTGYLARGKSAEDLVRHLAFAEAASYWQSWDAHERFPKIAKAFGIDDVKKIVDEAAPPAPKPEAKKPVATKKAAKPAKAKGAKKKPVTRKGTKK